VSVDVRAPITPTVARPRQAVSPTPARLRKATFALAVTALAVWAVGRAFGDSGAVVNTGGVRLLDDIAGGVLHPSLDPAFLRVVADAAVTTVAFAALGTAGALVLGLAGGLVLSDIAWSAAPTRPVRMARAILRGVLVALRSTHELVWALLLVAVLGLDPWVAVLALAIPFGAQTAQVFGETLDSVDGRPVRLLRSSGARWTSTLGYGLFPIAAPLLVSYAFYRFECALRSAVILGVAGVGGLGFELIVSLQSRNWDEVWTLVGALLLLAGIVEFWSTRVRRGSAIDTDPEVQVTCHACAVRDGKRISALSRSTRLTLAAVPAALIAAALWVRLSPSTLGSSATYRRAGGLLADLWPPRLPAGGWRTVVDATADTLSMAVLAMLIAVAVTLLVGPFGARMGAGRAHRVLWWPARLLLLVMRSIPPTVWAIVALMAFFPGIIPGALALGLYTGGILGRLTADAWESMDIRPRNALLAAGVARPVAAVVATGPPSATLLVTYTLYRFEICVRDTTIVGVVGAAGLGRLLSERLAAFDYQVVSTVLLASLAISLAVEFLSRRVRKTLVLADPF